jgi:Mlc titration factor MtfA (ptsG expression regulator)
MRRVSVYTLPIEKPTTIPICCKGGKARLSLSNAQKRDHHVTERSSAPGQPMQALIGIGVIALVIALAMLAPGWRLQRALKRPMPTAFIAILQRNIPIYPRMAPALQEQLHKLVQQFLHQKKFVGCEGLAVDDEMRVTIAALACLLLLNRPTRVYPGLHAVLLYPSAFLVPRNQVDAAGVVTETRQDLLGESWGDGRVVLSWDHVRRGAHDWTDGQNVVLHEFAHQLDSESGSNNGAPYLGSQSSYRSWAAVLSRDFANLQVDAMHRQRSVLDHYGATSPAEFFAVVTETFFGKPYQLAERHPALFAEFEKYYRVDPRAWQDAPAPPAAAAEAGYGHWQ